MEKIANVLNEIQAKTDGFVKSFYPDEMIDVDTAKVVNYIFKRLSGIIPAFKYSTDSNVQLDSLRREYTYALMKSGIKNMNRINAAIHKICLDSLTFLPSPGEFVSYCKVTHEDIGAPEPEVAYLEACRNSHPCETNRKWSHPAIRYAANATGAMFITSHPASESRPVFFENYIVGCGLHSDGLFMEQIEQKKPTREELQNLYWHEQRPEIPLPLKLRWVKDWIDKQNK